MIGNGLHIDSIFVILVTINNVKCDDFCCCLSVTSLFCPSVFFPVLWAMSLDFK